MKSPILKKGNFMIFICQESKVKPNTLKNKSK